MSQTLKTSWNKGIYKTVNFSRSSSNPNKVQRKFYQIWIGIRQRCSNKDRKNNKYYFDKGIKICDRWSNFEYFFIDMWDSYLFGIQVYKKVQIDRIDNGKGYYKVNCRWVSPSENMKNRGNTIRIKGKTFKEWEGITGIKEQTLRSRHDILGWSVDEILSIKTGNNHGRK